MQTTPSVLNWLNSNSGALSAIFSAIVTVSTVVYAILTWLLVKETRRIREAQTEPQLEVILLPLENAINLVRLHIKNIGLGPAYNLDFDFKIVSDTGMAQKVIEDFTKTNFLKAGLNYLGPGKERYSGYTVMFEGGELKMQSAYILSISYSTTSGQKRRNEFQIDLSELVGLYQLGELPSAMVAKSLKEIQKDIHNITSGFSKLEFVFQTKQEAALEKVQKETSFHRFVKRQESKQ